MQSAGTLLGKRLSCLRVAGKRIRARFLSSPVPPLPENSQLMRRRRFRKTGLEAIYWRDARPGRYRLYWSDAGTFDLDAREGSVLGFLRPRASLTAVEEVLRGPVCSFFLVEHGFEPLHAGSVILGGRCIAFVGTAGAGKSSLIAYLTECGAGFFSDDVLPLRLRGDRVRAFPGLGQIRLIPRAARALGWESRAAWKTRWKATVPVRTPSPRKSFPVGRLYLLDRQQDSRDSTVRFGFLTPREAFLYLVAHSMNPAEDAAWRLRTQLRVVGWLADRVPVRRLTYPSGFRHLERVYQRILEDLAS